jgi:hypothetical protein
MSTILKSLKKLEEEKSVLDKNLGLKHLVVQDEKDASFSFFNGKARRWGLGMVLVLGGIALGGVVVSWLQEEPTASIMPAPKISGAVTPVKPSADPAASGTVFFGVPMASIPEPAPVRAPRSESSLGMSQPRPATQQPPVAIIPAQPVEAPEALSSPESDTDAEDDLAALIQNAPIARPVEVSQETASTQIVRGHLPDFTMKGIIYFDEDSPSNYIMFSTSQSNNLKLKAGEKYLAATLEKIEPSRAIFRYQGNPLAIDIGE